MPDLLTTRQLAEYLQLSERSVYRMLERGELPATRVGGQWRFRKSAVDEWLDQGGVPLVDDVPAAGAGAPTTPVATAGAHATPAATASAMGFSVTDRLAAENIILDLAPGSPSEVLAALVERLHLPEPVERGVLLARLLERESLCSTAVTDGIAVPHTSRIGPRVLRDHDLIAIARTTAPFDFGALDGNPTSVFVLVLAADERTHLTLLAKVARLVREPGVRRALRTTDAATISAVLRLTESSLFRASPRRGGDDASGRH